MFEVARIMLGTQKMLMLSIVDDCDGLNKTPPPEMPTSTGTCEYVTLHGKRDFADVIKGTALEMERVFWMTQVGLIKSFKS